MHIAHNSTVAETIGTVWIACRRECIHFTMNVYQIFLNWNKNERRERKKQQTAATKNESVVNNRHVVEILHTLNWNGIVVPMYILCDGGYLT